MNFRAGAISFLSFTGMIDALYLSLKRNSGPIQCHITHGCTDVLTSRYSEVFGVPLSTIGLVFYVGIFSLAIFCLFGTTKTLKWIFWPASAAVGVSAVLVGIQAFALHAYCEYCLLSASLVLLIFILAPRPRLHTPLL